MTQMRNFSRKAYPKRNASVKNPKPKYGGKMLWGMHDHRMKCRDCTHYATHEALIKHEPNPFNTKTEATVQFCVVHGNKSVATGEVIRITPFDEFLSFQRELKKWESMQGEELQGQLV